MGNESEIFRREYVCNDVVLCWWVGRGSMSIKGRFGEEEKRE